MRCGKSPEMWSLRSFGTDVMRMDWKFLLGYALVAYGAYAIGGVVFNGLMLIFTGMLLYGLLTIMYFSNVITGKIDYVERRFHAGDKGSFSMKLYNEGAFFVPFARVFLGRRELETRSIKARSKAEVLFEYDFPKRGIYELQDLIVEKRDAFNIFLSKDTIRREPVKVYPRIRHFQEELFRRGVGNQGHRTRKTTVEDLYDTRELRKYKPGDGLRKINWKVSAKYGELFVKVGENTQGRDYLLVLDMHHSIYNTQTGPLLEEELVAKALGVSEHLMKKGIRHRFVTNGLEKKEFEITGETSFTKLVEYLVLTDSQGERPLGVFLHDEKELLKETSSVILFTGAYTDQLHGDVEKYSSNQNHFTIYSFLQGKAVSEQSRNIDIRIMKEHQP